MNFFEITRTLMKENMAFYYVELLWLYARTAGYTYLSRIKPKLEDTRILHLIKARKKED